MTSDSSIVYTGRSDGSEGRASRGQFLLFFFNILLTISRWQRATKSFDTIREKFNKIAASSVWWRWCGGPFNFDTSTEESALWNLKDLLWNVYPVLWSRKRFIAKRDSKHDKNLQYKWKNFERQHPDNRIRTASRSGRNEFSLFSILTKLQAPGRKPAARKKKYEDDDEEWNGETVAKKGKKVESFFPLFFVVYRLYLFRRARNRRKIFPRVIFFKIIWEIFRRLHAKQRIKVTMSRELQPQVRRKRRRWE